jgi:hypothetical protein
MELLPLFALLFVTFTSSAPPLGLDQVSQTALLAAKLSPEE